MTAGMCALGPLQPYVERNHIASNIVELASGVDNGQSQVGDCLEYGYDKGCPKHETTTPNALTLGSSWAKMCCAPYINFRCRVRKKQFCAKQSLRQQCNVVKVHVCSVRLKLLLCGRQDDGAQQSFYHGF